MSFFVLMQFHNTRSRSHEQLQHTQNTMSDTIHIDPETMCVEMLLYLNPSIVLENWSVVVVIFGVVIVTYFGQ